MGFSIIIQNRKVEEITFTPDESGAFAFTCPTNGAKGTMLVKELELGHVDLILM